MSNKHPELFQRHKLNPILIIADWPYPANSVFNPGATIFPDGETLLLCRVEDRRGHSHLCAARSSNGADGWRIAHHPTLSPDPEEVWGIEDPRISYIPEFGAYAAVYNASTGGAPGVACKETL